MNNLPLLIQQLLQLQLSKVVCRFLQLCVCHKCNVMGCCCCLLLWVMCVQENFLQTIASDWRYERALQGIRLLAQHHLGQLVQSLIAWRQAVNDDIKKNYSTNNVVNVQGVCKRVSEWLLLWWWDSQWGPAAAAAEP